VGTRPPNEDREDGEDGGEKPEANKTEPMVVSGGATGEDSLEGRPAILDLPAGTGRVIALNFNPTHRYLDHSDHRFLWNAFLNGTALPPAIP
jgi:hypothetical protein